MSQCKNAPLGNVHSFESFGAADGPGIRFVVFLKGCPLRCLYCHNPDSQSMDGGTLFSAQEILERALRYKSYFRENGGITVSGGEPLLQIEFVTELFRLAKKENISTVIDTSGIVFSNEKSSLERFDKLCDYTDLFLLDIKHINPVSHKALTSFSNENILSFAKYLSRKGKKMWIRHVLVPGYTDNEKDLRELGSFIKTLSSVEKTEVLPYHTLGKFKWEKLGIPYPLESTPVPSESEIRRAEKLIEEGLL